MLRRPVAGFLIAVLALACGGDELTLPNEGQPAEIEVLRGNGQNGTVGEPLADSLVVRVRDRFGTPVPNVEVAWTAEGGGQVDPAVALTDGDGRAGTQRILGAQPGAYTTIATVAVLPDAAVFTTTGVAARLSLTTQPSATAVAGEPFERQPALQLLDQSGAPIARADVVVTVQIATGGGTLDGTTAVPSDAAGTVTFTNLSLRGSPGTRTLIFAAADFASAISAPVALGVGAATSIAPVEGDEQTATVNTPVPTAPAVLVRDQDGNPVPGVPVTFSVTAGGGSVTGRTAATDGAGVARVGSWTLGATAGPNKLRALVEGAELEGSPVEFTATGTAGAVSAERSTIEASPGTIAASGGSSASTVTVTARDEFGNTVSGVPVGLASTGAGATLVQPDQPTDGDGVATGRLSATGVGPHEVSATIDGVALEATATVMVNAGLPAAENSSAAAGNGIAGVPTVITVELEDAFGNPVEGQGGRIAVQVTGANTATGRPAEDQGGGSYRTSYTPVRTGGDQIAILVDGAPVSGSPIASTVAPGPASPAVSTAEVPAVWRILAQQGPIPVVVTVRDDQGNLRPGDGDVVEVEVEGTTFPAVARGDGTYATAFPPPGLRVVQVHVRLNGTALAGSPYPVDIRLF